LMIVSFVSCSPLVLAVESDATEGAVAGAVAVGAADGCAGATEIVCT
jgi:hypothetical protein